MTFPEPPRLKHAIEQALSLAQPQQGIFWPNAKVYKPNDAHIIQLKQHVLGQLTNALTTLSQEKQNSVQQLITQIQHLPNAKAILQPIDWESLSLGNAHNPKLPRDYRVYLPNLPRSVEVLGALNLPSQTLWQPHAPIQRYLRYRHLWQKNAQLVLIQPTGEVQHISVSNEDVHLGPGGTLFVPFSNDDIPNAEPLNADIVQLLKNRP